MSDGNPDVAGRKGQSVQLALFVLFLLGGYWALAISSKGNSSPTFDELAHLTCGVSFWVAPDFRLAPESILLQRWAAIPVALAGYRFPDLDQPAWWLSQNWVLGHQFYYDLGNDADRMLSLGRMMIAVLGVALGLVVFLWSRQYFGTSGGFVSLVAFAFCPTMLAHGSLVTTDLGTTLFFSLSVIALWSLLHTVTPLTLLGSSLAVAGLFVSKMSGVLIIPMGLLLLMIRLGSGRPLVMRAGAKRSEVHGWRAQSMVFLGLIFFHVAIAAFVIWALFEFRYESFREALPGRDAFTSGTWDEILAGDGIVLRFVAWARERRILPEAYLYSFASSMRMAQARSAFLNGEVGIFGWRSFFPFCFLVKTPLPTLLLLVLAVCTWMASWWPGDVDSRGRRLADSLYRSAPLWVLVGVYGGVAVASRINIGHRHLLPIYPAILVWVGANGEWLSRRPALEGVSRALRKGAATLTILLLTWLVGETAYRWPYYLAFFNQVVGGPSHGYRHLVDSSLDWGQDLPGLKAWLLENDVERTQPVYLSYFGSARPAYYGIQATLLPCFFDPVDRQPARAWKAGIYCISATMLQGVYTVPEGRWTEQAEAEYQALLGEVRRFMASKNDEEARKKLVQIRTSEEWHQLLRTFDQYRLNRLCNYLRRREPDAHIGYSILIFRLTDDDLKQALSGPPPL